MPSEWSNTTPSTATIHHYNRCHARISFSFRDSTQTTVRHVFKLAAIVVGVAKPLECARVKGRQPLIYFELPLELPALPLFVIRGALLWMWRFLYSVTRRQKLNYAGIASCETVILKKARQPVFFICPEVLFPTSLSVISEGAHLNSSSLVAIRDIGLVEIGGMSARAAQRKVAERTRRTSSRNWGVYSIA